MSADCCERDRDSNLINLASAILGNPLLEPISVSDCPRPESDVFSIKNVDLILRSAVVQIEIYTMQDFL